MALQRMTIKDYVEYRQKKKNTISRIAVAKAIRMQHRTPGIKSFEKIGKTWVLYVDTQELDEFLVYIKKPFKLHA